MIWIEGSSLVMFVLWEVLFERLKVLSNENRGGWRVVSIDQL